MYLCVFIIIIIVKSWEGGSNIVDSALVSGDRKRKERERDEWDRELDRGKV